MLDRYCVGCHDGTTRAGRPVPARTLPRQSTADEACDKLRRRPTSPCTPTSAGPARERLPPAQARSSTTPTPANWSRCWTRATTASRLDAEAWDRLFTWIDLNVPDHGTWGEHRARAQELPRAAHRNADQVRQPSGRPRGDLEPLHSRLGPIRPAPKRRTSQAHGAEGGRLALRCGRGETSAESHRVPGT